MNTQTHSKTLGLENKELAYLIVRLGLGLNLFLHGLVRLPKLNGFVQYMEKTFSESVIPQFLVTPAAYAIPIVELILGLMLILGFKTKLALVGTSGLMMMLISGCCFIQNWGPINSQMFLLVIAAALISTSSYNCKSITAER